MRLSTRFGLMCNSRDACARRSLAAHSAANRRAGDKRFKANRGTP